MGQSTGNTFEHRTVNFKNNTNSTNCRNKTHMIIYSKAMKTIHKKTLLTYAASQWAIISDF